MHYFFNLNKYITLFILSILFTSPAHAVIDLQSSSDTWAEVLVGNNFDPGQDTQAVAAVDLTGFGTTPLFYMKYDDSGTPADTSDDEVAFRFRADHAVDNKGEFDGYIWIGLDVDSDNDIDAFMMLVGKSGVYNVDVYDAGNGTNTSPSTTDINSASITPVTAGFTFDHNLITTIDATGTADLDGDTELDYLISYKVNFDALATALNALTLTGSNPSATISTLNSNAGMTVDTAFQLVVASAQNANTLNGDIGGYDDKADDLTVSFASKGAFSSGLSFSNPEPAIADLTTSLITASILSIEANGSSTSTITVQLKDENGINLTLGGDTVTLSTTLGSLDTVSDNNNGTYSAILTSSTTSGLATITGTINTNNLTDTASVTYTPGAATTTTSTVSASSASITADGTSTSTITVQLIDTNGNNLNNGGDAVTLSTTLGSLGLVTDLNNGTYRAVLTSGTTTGTAIITGTLNTQDIDDNASVIFNADIVSQNTSIISVSNNTIAANGISTSIVTVQLKDSNGNNLSTGGDTVELNTTLGTLSSVTDELDGSYTATLTSSIIAGTATITGLVNSNSITDNATVSFFVSAASATTSLITASILSINADGTSTSLITVQLKDINGNNLSSGGDTVVLDTTLGNLSAVTDKLNGTYEVTLTSATTVGTATITGTLNGASITDDATVAFTVGSAVITTSVISASINSISADGTSTSIITVQLKDANGNVLSSGGDSVLLNTTLGSLGLVTDQLDGTYRATLTSGTTAGSATITGTLNGNAISNNASVVFISILDTDGDGIIDDIDIDDDNDGIPDSLEGDGITDSDGDGIVDSLDLDSDNDGITDLMESGITNPESLDTDNNGQIDTDNPVGTNGLADIIETTIDSGIVNYNNGNTIDTDGDGVEDFRDLDSDNDGIPDVTEAGGNDSDNNGIIGTGTPVVDSNGLPSALITSPTDTDGDGIPDHLQLDSDGDGISDLIEGGGTDSNDDGKVDGFTDNNGDGFDDGTLNTPLPLTDTDGDGTPDYQDNDDVDNDGITDSIDLDDDNDGIPDSLEGNGLVDTDGDGVVDSRDLDSDNDGLFDLVESGITDPSSLDSDNNGQIDSSNDVGSNGIADVIETSPDSGTINYNNGSIIDTDNDGIEDFRDLDSDNDGITDVIESGGSDDDNDGIIGTGTPTVNNNGLATGSGLTEKDTDKDGIPDQLDLDSDADGKFDLLESGNNDIDSDGLVDNFTDLDGNGFDDSLTLQATVLTDTDNDGTPDYLDTTDDASGTIRTGVDGIGPLNPVLILLLMPVVLISRYFSKTILLSLLITLPLTGNAESNNESDKDKYQRGVYIGAGIGQSLMAPETDGTIYSIDDDEDFSYKIYAGMDLTEHFSAEISFADLGTTTLQPTGEIDYETISFSALYYFYDQDENDHLGWAGYIKAGLGTINNSANVPYDKENSVQISMGAGIEYGWDNGLAARLDLESFDDDASLLTVGLLYRFGKKQKKPQPEPKPEQIKEPVDTDKDGIIDEQDECPNTIADRKVDSKGCELDTDKDGVLDSQDQCPESPEGVKIDEKGCNNDKDNDGVLNETDACPDTVKDASVNTQGCAIFETKIDGINFKVRSSDLTDDSKSILDVAAEALLKAASVRIEIQAHTDSRGKESANQKLSDARAKSVADYLESKGINSERMESKGYGETQPTASNDTEEGRAENRRVEFRVLDSE
ncbi:MAG: hypothetical protein DIZ80_17230 [endosymbiont of Galathealinum brachiosum]|uniref:OmpA-like domain-containing protein n=1 Tax=endosymbiont of Galathealinum brachiosum TaxID=2200906 RepID=A0A370D6Y5_9GAMM|nr:MAG: hypothetical protein DIZ80_17230 [endosymbiont of Galathealinum brachiosum]